MKDKKPLPPKFLEIVQKLEEKLGYTFKDKTLPLAALTHTSFAAEYKEKLQDYEVLEFLGDAVIGLIVSEILIKTFPKAREGQLSKIRSAVVSEPFLAKLARQIGLNELVLVSKGERAQKGMERESLLCDVFEAVFGAVYIDSNYSIDTPRDIFNRLFKDTVIKSIKEHSIPQDYKSILQELTQKKYKITPSYKLIDEKGPEHKKEFTVECKVSDIVSTVAKGKSKKEAETKAAKEAYLKLKDKKKD